MTPAPRRKVNFLRLVEAPPEPTPIDRATFSRPGWQNTLFADDHPSLLIVAELEMLGASDFIALLATARPRVVFELRRVPRFDIGHLNRRLVFELFNDGNIDYVDLSGRLNAAATLDAKSAAVLLTQALPARQYVSGPIVLLVDHGQWDEPYITDFVDVLPSAPDEVWDILKLPVAGTTKADSGPKRNLIFISHANPEDNGFAAWLSGKLAIAGYQVWSDVTRLIGGEVFWTDIEEAVRYHSAKVVVALSRASQTKSGVLDEIDLAIRVERSTGLAGFVVPIRLDNLPFADVRANLARKNIIDFSRNWGAGLSALLRVLQRDGVPRTVSAGAQALTASLNGGVRTRVRIMPKSETLVTNWLPIESLPTQIDMIDVDAPADLLPAARESLELPTFPYLRRLLGLFGESTRADAFELDGYKAQVKYRVPMSLFLSGAPQDLPGLTRGEARKFLVSLIRQAWDLSMRRRGLRSFEMASGHLAWFLPKGFAEGDKVSFIDDGGVRRRKNLVGWSESRQVFWHAALQASVVVVGTPRVVLRQHVIFTADGITPLGSAARMHALRRAFCKSWWNDRWRDILIAFVAWLSESGQIALPVGPSATVKLGAPLRLVSPISPEVEEVVPNNDDDAADFLDGSGDGWDDDLDDESGINAEDLQTDGSIARP